MAFPGKPTTLNLTLTLADTEYSQALPAGSYKIMIKARSLAAATKFSYVSGQSGTTYMTIPAGAVYWDDNINTVLTLYAQSPTAGTVLEILCWTGV